MEKVIEAIGISKIYGSVYKPKSEHPFTEIYSAKINEMLNRKNEFVALDNVDVVIEKGDFVCIMGPSGSGKTTLLNAISTIDMPTQGKVFIEGKDVRKMGEVEIGKFRYTTLGFIFQRYNLLDNLTIFENVAIPLTLAHLCDDEINERVLSIVKKVGIEDLVDKYPNECSGGEAQRCAIARALITNPKLIVADEPTGNLDSRNSHEILKLLSDLNKKEGVMILMVTHDSMIASYSKSLLFIKDGKIETVLKRNELKQRAYYDQIMDKTSAEAMKFLELQE